MGSLSIMDPSGHIEVKWSDDSATIELNPDGYHRATSSERNRVMAMLKECVADSGSGRAHIKRRLLKDKIVAIRHDKPLDKADEARCAKIEIKCPNMKTHIEKLVKSSDLSKHLVFRLQRNGSGQLIQKSDFSVDANDYQTIAPLVGG